MWNGHFDVLQRPNRAVPVPDRGSLLKNDLFAIQHNILSVFGVFGHPVYSARNNTLSVVSEFEDIINHYEPIFVSLRDHLKIQVMNLFLECFI